MNISIIGANHTKNIFCSDIIDNYEDFFEVKSYFHMTSIMSIMSNSINYDYNKLMGADLNNRQIEYWYYELEKPFLQILESKKPDILLMDFYADARYGVRSYCGEYVINRLRQLKGKRILQWNKFEIVYNYKCNKQDFIMMWKNRFDKFMDFMQENLPETQIVINTAKATNLVCDRYGKHYVPESLQDLDIDEINEIWKCFDNYAIEEYGLHALTIPETYVLQSRNGEGETVSPIDFQRDYYFSCFYELLDMKQQYVPVKNKSSESNLVIDSEFSKGLSKWTNTAGEYEIKEVSGIKVISPIDCRKELGKYRPQVWSRPMEIDGDGESEYRLSFYIKFEDLSKIKKDMVVFGIRTFQHVREIKSVEAVEEYRLTLEGHKVLENMEYCYVCEFTPMGRYIRVAPFLFRYLSGVEYSRIKLERISAFSEYKKQTRRNKKWRAKNVRK